MLCLAMRVFHLIVVTSFVSAAACSSDPPQPSKEDASQLYVAASIAMSSAQARAVSDAQQLRGLHAPAQLLLDFSGACTRGGLVNVTGSYDTSGTTGRTTFDMATAFHMCREAQGTLDGSLRWTSIVNGTSFSDKMKGELDWSNDSGASASCDFDVLTVITPETAAISGRLCGYDVAADLGIGFGTSG
jgi:hypothetical protein